MAFFTNGNHTPAGSRSSSPASSTHGEMYNSVEFLRGNKAPAGWVIQKFGGTSVGKFPIQIAEDIVKLYVAEQRVAIVCSARSTYTKDEGTTNRYAVFFLIAE